MAANYHSKPLWFQVHRIPHGVFHVHILARVTFSGPAFLLSRPLDHRQFFHVASANQAWEIATCLVATRPNYMHFLVHAKATLAKEKERKNPSCPKALSQRITTKEDIHTYFQHLCAGVAPESARRTLLPFLGCIQPRVVKA